jgi:hypothetical protein
MTFTLRVGCFFEGGVHITIPPAVAYIIDNGRCGERRSVACLGGCQSATGSRPPSFPPPLLTASYMEESIPFISPNLMIRSIYKEVRCLCTAVLWRDDGMSTDLFYMQGLLCRGEGTCTREMLFIRRVHYYYIR